MRAFLKECLKGEDGFVELRYHKKLANSVTAEKGRVENSQVKKRAGIGVRVLHKGTGAFPIQEKSA